MNKITTDILESYDFDIKILSISKKGIEGILDLSRFTCLIELDCSFNKIISVENLPHTLKILICNYNLIEKLDNLSDSLNILYCFQNKLTLNQK